MNYYCNDKKDVEIFRRVFGAAWETAAELDEDIGAFLMINDGRRAVLDGNAARIFGTSDLSYAELEALVKDDRGFFKVSFLSLEEEEDITAGFVRAVRTAGHEHLHYGLCNRRELAEKAGAYPDSVIMAVGIDGAQGSDDEKESCLFSAADALLAALPEGALMARTDENEFHILLPELPEDPAELARQLSDHVKNCEIRSRVGMLVSGKHSLNVSFGICCGRMAAAYKMQAADFALYEAKSEGGGIRLFDPGKYESRKAEYDRTRKFYRLLEDNAFIYHFQPIVNAHNGEIVAYEALMRSDPSIGYGPLEILDLAAKRGRLYDIEVATMRNSLAALSENQSFFDKRKLFINSIPSQLLKEEDYAALSADYGELLEKTVIEFTEHAEITDEALNCIKERLARSGMQLAIDDYGTGYSNTSNLMRYTPDYVKIDRSLIADIERHPKRQALVAGIIDYVHASGCMALAEGVETLEEIRTVINLSIDLLQGYYVSRPKPVMINEISSSVREEIVRINLESQGKIQKTYHASDGETIDMSEIALEKYTDIFIEGGDVTLCGERDRQVKVAVVVKEDAECTITLRGVSIELEPEGPALTLSRGSNVHLICEGENSFTNSSIFVPDTSVLRISGTGDLSVVAEAQDCCAIGVPHTADFGEIIVDMDGHLTVTATGDNGIGIGGGGSGKVHIAASQINVTVNCSTGVGIGSFDGLADLNIHDCGLTVTVSAAVAACVGSVHGDSKIRIQNIAADLYGSGNSLCAAGSLNGSTKLEVRDVQFSTEMRGRSIVNLGSFNGDANCVLANGAVSFYGEGGTVIGIGSSDKGSILVDDTELTVTFLTGKGSVFGCPNGSCELSNVLRVIKINE